MTAREHIEQTVYRMGVVGFAVMLGGPSMFLLATPWLREMILLGWLRAARELAEPNAQDEPEDETPPPAEPSKGWRKTATQ